MPPLARNLIDSNSMAVLAAWINSLAGLPALAPPVVHPAGGIFRGSALVTVEAPDTNATIHFTLDGSLPGEGSPGLYRAVAGDEHADVAGERV